MSSATQKPKQINFDLEKDIWESVILRAEPLILK